MGVKGKGGGTSRGAFLNFQRSLVGALSMFHHGFTFLSEIHYPGRASHDTLFLFTYFVFFAVRAAHKTLHSIHI